MAEDIFLKSTPMNAPSKSVQLPARVNSALLLKNARPGEPVIVLKIDGVGFTGDFEFQVEHRSFLFRYDLKLGGHVLRVPFHIWMQDKAKLAHDIMSRKQRHCFVTLIEFTPVATASEETDLQGGEPATRQAHNLKAEGSIPSPAPTVEPEPESAQETPLEAPGPIMYGEMPLHEAVTGVLHQAGSAVRIKAIAHQLDVSEDSIRTALEEPSADAEIASAGWVRIKVQETPAD